MLRAEGLPRRALIVSAAFQASAAATAMMAVACAIAAPAAAPAALAASAAAIAICARLWRAPLDLDRFAQGAVRGMLAALGATALLGLAATAAWLGVYTERLLVSALVIAIALTGIAGTRLWPSNRERSFVICALTTGALLRLGYVSLVRVEAFSDFGIMWSLASGAARGEPLPGPTEIVGYFPAGVYLERIVLYLLPLTHLAGGEDIAFRVANALVGVAGAWTAYLFTRRWYGPRAARLALLLSLFAVEPLLAATVPTHDIPGAFLAIVAAAVAAAMLERARSGKQAFRVAACLGVLLAALELQRTIGVVVIAALAVTAIAVAAERFSSLSVRRLALACLVMWGVFAGLVTVVRSSRWAEPLGSRYRRTPLLAASATDSWSTRLWGSPEDNYYHRYAALEIDRKAFVALKVLSDTHYSPRAVLSYFLRKGRELFSLASQTRFWLVGSRVGETPIGYADRERLEVVARSYWLVFGAALLLGLWRILRAREIEVIACLPLLIVAVLAAGLILLKGVQPRYLFLLWYLAAPCAGVGVAGRLPGVALFSSAR